MGRFTGAIYDGVPRGVPEREDEPSRAEWLAPEALRDGRWRYRNAAGIAAGLILGYGDEAIGMPAIGRIDDRHIVTVAGSRAGKGVSLIVPNLLLYQGSVLALDPKGELAVVTAAERERLGQRVLVVDPFEVTLKGAAAERRDAMEARCVGFNPLAAIDPDGPDVVDDAALIAEALIATPPRGDDFWSNSARALVKSLVLFALLMPEAADRNLVTAYDCLTGRHPLLSQGDGGSDAAMDRLWELMILQAEAFDGVIAATGAAMKKMDSREREGILAQARAETSSLDSLQLRRSLALDGFTMAELKRTPTTVYVCLPAGRLATHGKWFRLVLSAAMLAFEREPRKPDPPVLVVMDEFPVLGHMRQIEMAAGFIAGYGVRLWTVLQDLSQLQAHYAKTWETFFGNAGIVTFFGNADQTTVSYISKRLGDRSYQVLDQAQAGPEAMLAGVAPYQERAKEDALLKPFEVEMRLARETGRLLVVVPGERPTLLWRLVYHQDPGFRGKFETYGGA